MRFGMFLEKMEDCPRCGHEWGSQLAYDIQHCERCESVDNQHKLIKGYRDLSQAEIDLINEGKQLEKQVLTYLEKLNVASFAVEENQMPDRRWLAIGRTDIEKGFMSVIRSIAKPNT